MSRIADAASPKDPFLWLEEVEGARALEWVRVQNARSLSELEADPRYASNYSRALAIAEDRSRIPYGRLRGGYIYSFWQDESHVRGLWRRTRLESYETPEPQWEVLLDVDQLAAVEGRNWVFKGATALPPQGERCLISLSDGGKDACEVREFDVGSCAFVDGGFQLPEAKSHVAWQDRDTLLVATDWGQGSLTESGYPYIIKAWRRGEPLSAAHEVFCGRPQDVVATPGSIEGDRGERLLVVVCARTFFTSEYSVMAPDGSLGRITAPGRADLLGLYQGELLLRIKQDWTLAGRTWRSGSLLSMPLAEITAATPAIRQVLAPGSRETIEDVAVTAAGALVALYSNVRGRILRLTFAAGVWNATPMPLPDNGAVSIITANEGSGVAQVSYENFLTPATLYRLDVAQAAVRPIKSLPPKFDASRCSVEQLEAVSKDGTRVPYFVVRPKDLPAVGPAPTLLYAYGGFEVSMLPAYSGVIGQLWLEQGGAYVLANIRGGGEFGPAWHEAGRKTRRQVVYDDFIAVAEDLAARGITSARRLGIEGGSNGGLLMGVMLTQRPELFRAAVVQVPLLDMLRFDRLLAGASWVDEYGSPAVPEERAWLARMSPYQNLQRREDFPRPFILTSTKDDRVHPGHARKYGAKLESLGMPFLYYENTEGGHSAAADQRERARRLALEFTYLARRLVD